MSTSTGINIATADKQELLSFLEQSGVTVSPDLSTAAVREKAHEVNQTLLDSEESDELEARAKAAAARELSSDKSHENVKKGSVSSKKAATQKKFSLDSLDVFPHDGKASSINEVITEGRRTSLNGEIEETVEERIIREQSRKKDDLRVARLVAAADAEIREYHRNATTKHRAKITNVCFFLLDGMHLGSFHTPYTKIPAARLRKETPYRALDVELKYFRSRRKMFGECAYIEQYSAE